ncbi:MAG: helix-turn-helix domain-containing protein [Gammaproteobacteria bacterium]|nr:helix-turn-helix domain-containing protein [Gammaproteobacteria bacterium]
MDMNNWAGRLKIKMKEVGLTQEELARKLGLTRSAVAHYVQGTRHPPIKTVLKLATILNTDPAWLQFGKLQEQPKTNRQQTIKHQNHIPIIDWQHAIDYHSEKNFDKNQKYLKYFSYQDIACYALLIKGDAMIAPPLSQNLSFNPGSYIVINPNKLPEHNSYVIVATTSKKEPILRQYIEEGGFIYLKPLNPQYPLVQLERNTKILGVVVANINFI